MSGKILVFELLTKILSDNQIGRFLKDQNLKN